MGFRSLIALAALGMGLTSTEAHAGTILHLYDSFGSPPAEQAGQMLGHAVISFNNDYVGFSNAYDSGDWDLVIIDVPGFSLSADVKNRVSDRATAELPLIFSWWDLDTDAALASDLGVSTLTYSTPREIYPDAAPVYDFFNGVQTVPVPLRSSDDATDNGDELTLLGAGSISARLDSDAGPGIIAVTNNDMTIVNGFLPWDYQSGDADGDGMTDIVELYQNEISTLISAPTGPEFSMIGSCPGPVTLAFSGFTPGGQIGILKGTGPGSDLIPGGPCGGGTTGLTLLGLQAVVPAGPGGGTTITVNLGGGACTAWLEALDVASCVGVGAAEIP